MIFLFFFSLSSIKLLLFPNVYNNPAWQNKKKEEENNHPTTKPSDTTKLRNLAQKINPKSTRKSNSKSRQTH